jgi:hypothetical protein
MEDRCKHRTEGEGNKEKNCKHVIKDTGHSTMSWPNFRKEFNRSFAEKNLTHYMLF